MQGPYFLPNHLASYCIQSNDRELFKSLKANLDDLILFFELACEDEKWAHEHHKFLSLLLRWAAKQYYLGHLSLYDAKRILQIIQKNYFLLKPLLFFQPALFFTVKIQVEGQGILVNSLLFGVGCPALGSILKRECFEKLNDRWILLNVRLPVFRHLETYLSYGELPDLWTYDSSEIFALMDLAKRFSLQNLLKDCASSLKRDIHVENVAEIILKAHQQGFIEWKEEAYSIFNQQGWGIRFLPGSTEDLKIEFLNFDFETLTLFRLFAPWVTHLAFGGYLSKESGYQETLSLCLRLRGVDLSGSNDDANQLALLPSYLLELALSACFWLQPTHLRLVSRQCPHLRKLELANNSQLNALAWGELHHFHQLRILNLARCHQLAHQDLKLIGQVCPLLSDLNLEECRNLDDRAIAALVAVCPNLHALNLSYCDQLTDRVLREIALHLPQLTNLQLFRCIGLTDKGVQQLVKLRPSLKYLNVQGCVLSLETLRLIRQAFPHNRLT